MRPTLLIDRSDRSRFDVSGAHAVATLNGLVTNDVAALRPGHGQYAAVLTAKGKIVADVIVLMAGDTLRLHASAEAGPGLHAMLVKFINPRFATLRDVSAATFELSLIGEDAAAILSVATQGAATREALAELAPYSHANAVIGDASVLIMSLPAIGSAGEAVFGVTGAREHLTAIRSALHAAGAREGDRSALDTMRVESGIPAWGTDMDDSTLPQEANLDDMHAVSYTKGCYIGQETVARIHFRGHVNKSLRRLEFTGDQLPPRGAVLHDSEHRGVGDVRSTARSEQHGLIGIGMVRREIEDGDTVEVHWDGGGSTAIVAGKAKGAID
ncbi:MAG: hypothetical protein M3Z30_06360 [Gemmatimonadota bacterium]|nr:hypothetical protein [Gemmatimonadota bacterium]